MTHKPKPAGSHSRTSSPSPRPGRNLGRAAGGRNAGRGAARSGGERAERRTSKYEPAHIADDIVKELHATARPGKGEILEQVFADAVAGFLAEDYAEAIRLGDQAKHIALRSIAVREFLGLAYYRAGRWKEAARELAAYKRISGSTDQNPVLADCYRAMGRPERALELCGELRFKDSEPPVYYECAIVSAGAFADMGEVDAAIALLERLDLRPEVAEQHHLRTWYALADLLERRGRFTQASEWFEAVAAVDPDLTDAPERVGLLRTMPPERRSGAN